MKNRKIEVEKTKINKIYELKKMKELYLQL